MKENKHTELEDIREILIKINENCSDQSALWAIDEKFNTLIKLIQDQTTQIHKVADLLEYISINNSLVNDTDSIIEKIDVILKILKK